MYTITIEVTESQIQDILDTLNKYKCDDNPITMEEVKNKRQECTTAFENFDQKANQLFNLLSSVMKAMKEMEQGIIRNIL